MRLIFAVSCFLPLTFAYASAQEAMPKDMHHDHHEHAAPSSPKKETAPEPKQPKGPADEKPADKKTTSHSNHIHGRTKVSAAKHQGHREGRHQAHTGGMHQGGMHVAHEMKGFLGPYPITRQAAGTS